MFTLPVLLFQHLSDPHSPCLSPKHAPVRRLATSKESFQVHVFCDASERAYGAALYIRSTKDDETLIRLACSKNRLAPVKRIILPRLELLAALVGARLLHYFCRATDYDIYRAVLWSDATVALDWICSDPNKWKTFVCNRVTEIQTYTNPAQWRHCPGLENPADHLSRGILGDQIPEYLVARTIMACTACGGLAKWTHPDESLSSRREKKAKPSSDNNYAYQSDRRF